MIISSKSILKYINYSYKSSEKERMNNKEKKEQLKEIIIKALHPLMNKKCVLLDAPYYHNIGDVLIWEGEKAFLQTIGCQCIYTASYETCTFPTISPHTTILFNGGGNLGDIYHEHTLFLLEVVKTYPKNRIIICPQTVYYQNKNLEIQNMTILQAHNDLYFCARDKEVYTMLHSYFKDKTLLLPDMAFCITAEQLRPYLLPQTKQTLIIDRNDCEKQGNAIAQSSEYDVSDWPVFEQTFHKNTFLNKLFKQSADASIPLWSTLTNSIWNNYAQKRFCHLMVKEGVHFISPYRKVVTTRLHGCILSILLNKEVQLIDNSYGKNQNFYLSWLQDLDSLTIYKK